MTNKTAAKTVIISLISGTIGYTIHLRSDLLNGVLTTFMVGWIIFQFRSKEKTWKNLGNFQNPILFGINTAFASYIYTGWHQIPAPKSLRISIGAFMLGAAASFMISKYWNIGP